MEKDKLFTYQEFLKKSRAKIIRKLADDIYWSCDEKGRFYVEMNSLTIAQANLILNLQKLDPEHKLIAFDTSSMPENIYWAEGELADLIKLKIDVQNGEFKDDSKEINTNTELQSFSASEQLAILPWKKIDGKFSIPINSPEGLLLRTIIENSNLKINDFVTPTSIKNDFVSLSYYIANDDLNAQIEQYRIEKPNPAQIKQITNIVPFPTKQNER
jgi:hypothetical protein